MSRLVKIVLIGGLALIAPGGMALAADIPVPPTYYYPPAPEATAAWYVRFDVGYKLYRTPSATFDLPAIGYFVPGTGEFINETISPTGVVGFGVGYDTKGVFRFDITIDYEWPGQFRGNLERIAPCTPAPDPEYSTEWANISAWTFLLNGYVDFGQGKFTPYIGGGIGVSRLTTSNVSFNNPDGTSGTWAGMSTWNLAWALTGGLAVERHQEDRVRPQLSLRPSRHRDVHDHARRRHADRLRQHQRPRNQAGPPLHPLVATRGRRPRP